MKFLYVPVFVNLAIFCQAEITNEVPCGLLEKASLGLEIAPEIKNLVKLRTVANLDVFVDRMVEHTKGYILKHHLEPKEMKDYKVDFYIKDEDGVDYNGTLYLKKGKLRGLSTILRAGDLHVWYDNKTTLLETEFGYKRLKFDYNFYIDGSNYKKSGKVTGFTDYVEIVIDAVVDLEAKKITLQEWEIGELRVPKVYFYSLGALPEFVISSLGYVMENFFDSWIRLTTDQDVREIIEAYLSSVDIDEIIGYIRN